ncbi:MAG TPA: VanZ family protein [Anaerolineales bacterium]|nr:VanZ family protein [Anaerolineales bacterium]
MKQIVPRWLPAFLMMSLIFFFSSQPSDALPIFGAVDAIVKKSSHMIGYALLALSYWFALGMGDKRLGLAWFLSIMYAVTDEYHQSFVPGRTASVWDVVIFDNLGALFMLWWAHQYFRRKQPGELA